MNYNCVFRSYDYVFHDKIVLVMQRNLRLFVEESQCYCKYIQRFSSVICKLLGIPTCWYLKTRKFALPPMRNPNASQWNITYVGSQTSYLNYFLATNFTIVYRKVTMLLYTCITGADTGFRKGGVRVTVKY